MGIKSKDYSKSERAVVFFLSAILLLFTVFQLLRHIDYFSTRQLTNATIITVKENKSKDGMMVSFYYFDNFQAKGFDQEISTSNSFGKDFLGKKKMDVYYTRFFRQVLIVGYKNPRLPIFLLDLVLILLFYFSIRLSLRPININQKKSHT